MSLSHAEGKVARVTGSWKRGPAAVSLCLYLALARTWKLPTRAEPLGRVPACVQSRSYSAAPWLQLLAVTECQARPGKALANGCVAFAGAAINDYGPK